MSQKSIHIQKYPAGSYIGHSENKRSVPEYWCGEKCSVNSFSFQSTDHAAISQLNGSRLVPCPKCVKAVKEALDVS